MCNCGKPAQTRQPIPTPATILTPTSKDSKVVKIKTN